MKIYYTDKKHGVVAAWPNNEQPIHDAADYIVPEGEAYAIGDEVPAHFPFISGGLRGAQIKQLRSKIAAIDAELLPEKPPYPEQPVNDEAEQRAAIQTTKDAIPGLLPVNEPFQTQEDVTNAVKNANAIAAYDNAVASAENGFVSYDTKLAAWQAECDKVDQQFSTELSAHDENKIQRIQQLQNQIISLMGE